MVNPIIVNVGRAGAANLDVIQEVEYVKEDVKIPYLLQCLQKTAPPVIIFCERKGFVGKIDKCCMRMNHSVDLWIEQEIYIMIISLVFCFFLYAVYRLVIFHLPTINYLKKIIIFFNPSFFLFILLRVYRRYS